MGDDIASLLQEVDKWLRSRALENVATATATLKSLVQLLEEVGNIVINDDIGQLFLDRVTSRLVAAWCYSSTR